MNSTKEQITQAAMKCFKTVEVKIGTSTVTLRELSHTEREALDKSNFQMSPDGKYAKDDKGNPIAINPERYMERWIAATITPAFTVEELIEWPESLKIEISDRARQVNNIEPSELTEKNS